MDAPEVPRLREAADEALELYDSYERFFVREYRGVVELAYALSGNRAGAEDIAAAAADRGPGPGPGLGQAGAGPGRAPGQ